MVMNRRLFSLLTKGSTLEGIIGVGVILLAEVLLILKVDPIPTFFTPIAWTGYIIAVDSLVFRVKGESLIRSRRGEFLFMLPFSVLIWLCFEGYNLHLKNWRYINLPANFWVRWLGFVWSFATILPAILETTELYSSLKLFDVSTKRFSIKKRYLILSGAVGLIFLVLPIILAYQYAKYMVTAIWVGFPLLLEPVNYWLGRSSVIGMAEKGRLGLLFQLFAAGLTCGLFWEFWNWWARSKWVYEVPFGQSIKFFEIPLIGLLGFLPFALGEYDIYYLVAFWRKKV